jgi:iron complex outermembrane receptor protein
MNASFRIFHRLVGCSLVLSYSFAPSLEAVAGEANYELPEISVLGVSERKSPFDLLPTVTKLSGSRLERRKEISLGETLSKEAGVSSTFFGPNASRPVIRGLDGERVRMLENGIGLLDASGSSPDHAVAVDPLVIDSIEILRGPGALIYGSSAVGGVVNLRTKRISEKALEKAESDFSLRYSGVDQGKAGGAVVRAPIGEDYVLSIDGSIRSTENYSIPGFARTNDERAKESKPDEAEGSVPNSSNRTSQAAIGVSRLFDKGNAGFAGLSLSGYLTDYGTVAEEDVRIGMDRVRLDASGEWKRSGFFDSIRAKSAYTKYEHEERNSLSGETGTIFRSRGVESRIDAKRGGLLVGLQQQYFRMSAIGDEAFLPTTRNSSIAAFGLQEAEWGRWKPSLGVRLDSASVIGEAGSILPTETRKQFFAPSASLGFQYALTPADAPQAWTLGLNSTYTERAPNYQELFAEGPHMATGIYEKGSDSFSTEKSTGLELSLKAKSRQGEFRLSGYLQDFSNFIALSPSPGQQEDGLDVYEFRAIRARIFGSELEYLHRLTEQFLAGRWELDFKADWMRGLDRTHGGNLPRMVPARGTIGARYQGSLFSADAELQRVEGQNLLAANEVATRGYTWVNLGAEVPVSGIFSGLKAIFRAQNLFNVEARNHISFLKELAPLPGRNFIVGIQGAI